MTPRDWPIGRKFVAGTLAITLTAIAFVSVFLIVSEQRLVRAERVANTHALLGMVANNAAASLVFDDEAVAQQILAGTTAEPTTRAAALYRSDGSIFASFSAPRYTSPIPQSAQPSGAAFTADHLDAFADVLSSGKKVGTAFVRTDLSAMRERFRGYTMTVLGCSAVAVVLVLVLARLLQRLITQPLLSLSSTAAAVTQKSDFSLRARKLGQDEVGQLVDAFNRMLEEVETSQQKVRTHAASLEQQVNERTARLSEMVAEMEAFSYSVSHDLRAPLRTIRSFAEVILETPAGRDAVTGHHLRRIARAAQRMDRLIVDLLAYSKVAKTELKLEPLDLDDVIDDVLADYPQFAASGAEIEIRKPLGRVLGHNAAISQAIYNLMANATKFVPDGRRPAISIWAHERGPNRRLFIRDNGVGIAEEDLSRLFRIFERAQNAAKFDGNGVGLSIVRRAVEKMNGEVGATSALGEGSTFWLELPQASPP
jgi:signal transduction histidine kinase